MEITPPSPPPPSFSPLNFLSASFSKKKTLAASIHQLGTTVLFVRGRRRGKGRRWENCFLNPSLPFQIAVLLPVFQRMASELSSALPQKERGTKKKREGRQNNNKKQQQQQQNGISFMTLQLLGRKRKQELSV